MKPKDDLNFWHIPLGIVMAVAFLALLMCSCKTIEYVPIVEHETHHDSIYFTQIQRDSIWQHDSILIKQKGDTVLIEKWHTKYREKQVHDTTYVAKTDSVPVPYEVIKEVPAKLSKTQKGLMTLGIMTLMAGVIFGAFWLKKILRL
jgi:hypothetical protein